MVIHQDKTLAVLPPAPEMLLGREAELPAEILAVPQAAPMPLPAPLQLPLLGGSSGLTNGAEPLTLDHFSITLLSQTAQWQREVGKIEGLYGDMFSKVIAIYATYNLPL